MKSAIAKLRYRITVTIPDDRSDTAQPMMAP